VNARPWAAAGAAALALACGVVHADDDRGRKRGHAAREFKQEFWDGPCKVELEQKADGSYKHERKCQGGDDRDAERKEEFRAGGCLVKREWKRDGDFKEERDCDGKGRRVGPPPRTVVMAPPPWVVIDKGEPVYRPGREPDARPPGRVHECRSEAVGRLLGGIAGAVIGSQIGKGSDARPAATIGGAILGVIIGGEIGRRMDEDDQACIGRVLEFGVTGQRVAWTAADRTQYAVTPGSAVQQGGRWCRPYEAEVLGDAGWRRSRGSACRAPDGTWAPRG
jgi:surface antigen